MNVLFIWAQTGEIERLLFWERNGVRHPDDLGLRIQTASRFSSLDTIGWLVAIGATVAFLVWFHRAYVNLSIAHGTTMYAPGWAIGVWFIPVLNLWRPYFMTSELLPGTVDGEPADDRPSRLTTWWVLWTASGIVALLISYGLLNELPGLLVTLLDCAASTGLAVSALLAIRIVRIVTDHQDALLGDLAGGLPPTRFGV